MNIVPLQLVTFILVLHIMAISTGLFDDVKTELGFDEYAERKQYIEWLGVELMVFNTIVNYGYAFVGGYWHGYFSDPAQPRHTLSLVQASKASTFRLFGEMYGLFVVMYFGVQFYRVVFHTQASAILDQWITPTIFCHVILWLSGVTVEKSPMAKIIRGHDPGFVYLVSFAGYLLTLVSSYGFEVDLGLHILIGFYLGWESQSIYGDRRSKWSLIKCAVCCVGFVVLKLLDIPLKDVWTPNCLSGHFLSKLCDIGQVYYAAEFVDRIFELTNEKDHPKHK